MRPEGPAAQAAAAPAAPRPEHAGDWQPESGVPAGQGDPYPQRDSERDVKKARGDQGEDLDASMASAI